jgi:hypothetical protein
MALLSHLRQQIRRYDLLEGRTGNIEKDERHAHHFLKSAIARVERVREVCDLSNLAQKLGVKFRRLLEMAAIRSRSRRSGRELFQIRKLRVDRLERAVCDMSSDARVRIVTGI